MSKRESRALVLELGYRAWVQLLEENGSTVGMALALRCLAAGWLARELARDDGDDWPGNASASAEGWLGPGAPGYVAPRPRSGAPKPRRGGSALR